MSASTLTTIRNAVKASVASVEAKLVKAEEAVGSLQLRYGLALAPLKDAAGKDFKAEAAKVSKRPYGTLNRWANAGRTAAALGFTVDTPTLPALYRIEPGFRFIRDARTPDAFAEGVKELEKWWKANRDKDAATALKAAEKAKPSSPAGNGGGNGGNGGGDSSQTVTVDPAAIESAAKVLDQFNRELKRRYKHITPAQVKAIRLQTLRFIDEHKDAGVVALNS